MTDAPAPPPEVPQLRTLLLTDLCDSVALVEKLGDANAAELFKRHDSLVLELQQRWRGRLIDRSDGLLLLFERPIDGLGFALDYSRGLHALGAPRALELKVRAGLHVGEVLTWRNSDAAVQVGAKPLEVEGLAKPTAARLMTLARPGQILLSAVAESLTHRAARELGERGERLLWKSHGRWRFKGVPTPLEIYEVGEIGHTPLRAPKPTPKAWRDIPLWRRPAALAAEAALIAAFALGAWFVTRPQPAIAFAERDWVVVGDLRNLTGDVALDDSLQQAFRISLEQSRYVNVLSDLKVRDTLTRMRRDPEHTPLDRATASEIAQRDGARAVLLATVSEVGGRVRVSAEVVDPKTQATVYAESRDGRGAGSVLASIDAVTTSLREQLGEGEEIIRKNSPPLPSVTTSSLDALKAYAIAVKYFTRRDFQTADQYFAKAAEIDKDFALAYMGSMRVEISTANNRAAMQYLAKAMALRDHLSERDALYLDAWASELGPHPWRQAKQKWKMLSELYPDYYAGAAQFAWDEFTEGNYASAAHSVQKFAVPQNPLRDVAVELQGRIYLAQGRYGDALNAFKQAEELGGYPATRRHAAAFAAMKDYAAADRIMAALASSGAALTDHFEQISIPLDQGRLRDAAAAAQAAVAASADAEPVIRYPLQIAQQAVAFVIDPRTVDRRALARIADGALQQAVHGDAGDRDDLVIVAMSAIRLAQRSGDPALYDVHATQLASLVAQSGFPPMTKLLSLLRAQQLIDSGKPAGAVALLREQIDGREPYQLHVSLRDALLATGEKKQALAENDWLVARRGLAYIEPTGGLVLQSMNVADANLAVLSITEILASLGQTDQARQKAETFRRAWAGQALPTYLAVRLATTEPASKQ
ncbi:putative peptide modification system cyclase [Xanthomonas sp. LMG 8992]|uniref:putative peptide modification system cyclase n=1 Tax=Xanthomonas sp. LMG 8992 TaxID=1591157 RepID=UPI001368A17F|nr:putative peptide modification system cyclase [Xanthomonas sp. LMG 8992]MXV11941.1 putative peptide modification system cyclase [Xanthomonas sp. LMG 8992]